MCESVEDVIDNILSRLANGPLIDEDELDKTIEVLDQKLQDLDELENTHQCQLNTALEEANSSAHPNLCSSDSDGLHCFLNNVLQAAERKPGYEDHLLNDFVLFCNRNNMILPVTSDQEKTNVRQSQVSLNALADEDVEKTTQIWIKIKSKLRNGILSLLKSTYTPNAYHSKSAWNVSMQATLCYERRLHLLELLYFIHSFEEVMSVLYCLRQWEIEQKDTNPKNSIVTFLGDEQSIRLKSVLFIERIIENRLQMFSEDFKLISALCTSNELKFQSLQNFVDLYNESVKINTKTFINSHSFLQTSDQPLKFTAGDLRNFVKVFYCLNEWSNTISTIFLALKNAPPLDTKLLNSKSSNVKMSDLVKENYELHPIDTFWNWKDEFKELLPTLKTVVGSYIHCLTAIVLNTNDCTTTDMKLVCVSEKVIRCAEQYPLQVSQSVGTFTSLLNEVILFAKYDDSGVMNDLREDTLLAMMDTLNDCAARFHKILSEFHEDTNIDFLYVNLCNICFFCHQIDCWGEVTIGKGRRQEFLVIRKLYTKLRDDYIDDIVGYHLKIIKSTIVYDTHSNNWEDDKALFEGERCSFTIQMWNFYLRGLVYDILDKCGSVTGKQIVKKICTEMLTFFVFRYAYVKPSYRRVNQVKADILIILQVNKWLLNFLADDVQDILSTKKENFKEWHILCNALLENLVVLTAPISLISTFMENEQQVDNHGSSKIIWFNQLYLDPESTDELEVAFDIMVNQEVVDLNLLTKILNMDNAKLPKLLLKHKILNFQNSRCQEDLRYLRTLLSETVFKEIDSLEQDLNEMFYVERKPCIQSFDINNYNEKMYHILLHTNEISFIQFLASILETDDSKSFKQSETDKLPDWLKLIAKDLHPYFCRIFLPVLTYLFHKNEVKHAPSFAFTKVEFLPCDCPAIPENEETKFPTTPQLLHTCLMKTLQSLNDTISVIPSVIWNALSYVKGHKEFTASWLTQPYLGTKILACLLYNWLETKENIDLLKYGRNISYETYENITSLAELIWHVVFHLTHDVTENPKISMSVFKDLQKTEIEVKDLLNNLHKYCNKEAYTEPEQSTSQQSTSRLKDDSSLISNTEKGLEALNYIALLLKTNKTIVKKLLSNNGTPREDLKPLKLEEIERNLKPVFNPLVEFQLVGETKLNHNEIMTRDLNWDQLIPCISRNKWKTLVFNRFEFQLHNDSMLTGEETKAVHKIKEWLEYEHGNAGNESISSIES